MQIFVFSKIQAEAGERLEAIIARKEMERLAGGGLFWWGIGKSLGTAVHDAAKAAGGTLPVLFSKMLSKPKSKDVNPDEIIEWTAWEDAMGVVRDLPNCVKVTSRGGPQTEKHFALVCRSEVALNLSSYGPFDPSFCHTPKEKKTPGSSQVTALLLGDHLASYPNGRYQIGFRATLVAPWMVKLVRARRS